MLLKKDGTKLIITESVIRYAMENTKSNKAAASFLNISYNSYKKYAKTYIDEKTGLSLFELHKNQEGAGISKGASSYSYKNLRSVISGHIPEYPAYKLKKRLLKEAYLEEKCARCGFEEKRITDDAVPVLLNWIDGDRSNHRLDNLEMLCYNCYFLTVDNIYGKKLDIDNF